MTTIGAYEAKTHLPRLLEEVAAGKRITITKHGRPIAMLVPAEPATSDPDEVIEAIKAARQGVKLGRLSVRRLIEEGRR